MRIGSEWIFPNTALVLWFWWTDPGQLVLKWRGLTVQQVCWCLCSPPDAQIKVMCGREYMSIRAAEEFFSYHKVALESLHLPNGSCRAQREVIGGTAFYMFRISREKYLSCGGKPLRVKPRVPLLQTFFLLHPSDDSCSVAEELHPPPVLPDGPIRTAG